MTRRNRLTLAKVEEVSLVDAGDNPRAHVLIHKRAPSPTPADASPAPAPTDSTAAPSPVPSGSSVLKRIPAFFSKLLGKPEDEVQKAWDDAVSFGDLEQQRRMRAAVNETWDFAYLWQESVSSILRDPDVEDRGARIITSTAEFSAAVTAAVTRWVKGETTEGAVEKMIAKAGRAMSTDRLTRLKEAHTTLSAILAEVDPTPATEDTVADTTIEKNKAPADTAAGELTEDVLKALPEGVRKAVEGMQAAVVTATAAATAAQEIAKAERELRETAEIQKRFDPGGDLHGLPGAGPELVATLKSLKGSAPEAYAQLDTTLKSAAEVARKSSLFTEIGKGGDAPAGETPLAKLQAKAEEVRKAHPALSPEQALVKAMDDPANATLVAEYRTHITGGR